MKNIEIYIDQKYNSIEYVQKGYGVYEQAGKYYISFSFEQEKSLGEGCNNNNISQYPLEDILEKYDVYVSDFYDHLNNTGCLTCYLEFCGYSFDDILKLKEIVGKHVYNKLCVSCDNEYVVLVIE